jgi:hypothetical protein
VAVRPDKYILDAHGEPQAVEALDVWGEWYTRSSKDRSRMVAQDKDESGATTIMISTVFLGLDHNYAGVGPPVLWETLVFGGALDGEMDRYTSREAAFRGHQAMCARVRETVTP